MIRRPPRSTLFPTRRSSDLVYVRESLVRELEPSPVGWMAVKGSEDFTRLTDYALDWHDDARRFEMVTLPYQDFAAMDAILALLESLGPACVESHVRALAARRSEEHTSELQ